MKIMNELRKYFAIAYISAKANLAYASEVGSRLFFLAIILYIFMRLWKITYQNAGTNVLGGLTLNEMLWYLVVTESICMSSPRISQLVDEDVRTGTIAVQLVRPLSYPLYRLFACLGERYVRFVVTLAAGSVIAFYLVGPFAASAINLVAFLVAVPLAFILDFLGYFLVGLGAFWMEDTSGAMLIYSRLTMILGGMLIPLQLFPSAVRPLLEHLPFASIVYGPARMFVKPDATALLGLYANQLFWILIMGAAVAFVYAKATKRIAAQGG